MATKKKETEIKKKKIKTTKIRKNKRKGLGNLRQEKFCQLYASDREFFGNGVESYLEVYNIDRSKKNWYKTACAATSQLLSNIKVIDRINEILDGGGLNDAFVDKQMLFLIRQHRDFNAKVAAIREYNKLKQRITEKMEHTGKDGQPLIIQTVNYSEIKK